MIGAAVISHMGRPPSSPHTDNVSLRPNKLFDERRYVARA